MATREELMTALRNAHDAGDTEAAKRIAAMVPSTSSALPKATKMDYALTEKPGVAEEFMGGAKHAWDKAASGLQSLVAMTGLPVGESLDPLVKQGEEFVKNTGAASTVGNIAGEIGMTAVPGSLAFKAARAAPIIRSSGALLQNTAGGAAAGAAGNAVMGHDIAEGAGMGALLGPAGHLAGRAASGITGAFQDVAGGTVSAATKRLNEFLGDRAGATVTALRNLRGMVPGEVPTAGRAASELLPELKVLEEQALARPGAHNLMTQLRGNEGARAQVLENIADGSRVGTATQGGPIPQSRFQADRSARVDPDYTISRTQNVPLSQGLQDTLDGALLQPAVRDARQIMSQTAANGGTRTAPAGMISHDELQAIKRSLDAEVRALPPGREKIELDRARRQIDAELRAASPEYTRAQDNYRTLSQPQNQGEVADVLLSKLRAPGQGENVQGFLGAMDNAPRTIKNAMGDSRFQQMEQVMSPQQMVEINALRNSATREAEYQNLKAPSGIVKDYLSVFDQIANATPGIFNQIATVTRAAAKRLGARSDEQVNALIGDAIRDPNRLAAMIEATPPQQRNAVINLIRRVGSTDAFRGGSIGMAVPNATEE